jgi:uncharacterized protein (TIGR00730 family)
MMKRKTVTVFGSSIPIPGEVEYENAYKLGLLLGENNLNVCTGGYRGIMDAVSKGAVEKGGEAIGVTVDIFNAVPSPHLTKEIKCHSLLSRIEKLIELGDAFIVLPGGTGTLVELAIVWEMFNKNLLDKKPFACVGKMWKPVIDQMEERILIEKRKSGLIKWFDNIDDCARFILLKLGHK